MAYWDRNRSAAHPSGHYALYHFAPLGIPSLIFRARQRMPPRPLLGSIPQERHRFDAVAVRIADEGRVIPLVIGSA